MITTLSINISGKGLHDITPMIAAEVLSSGLDEGLCTLFIQHTSASLLIQENYDPSARIDLQSWFERLVPENDPIYTHTSEGADDMPAHIKSALTATSLSIPVIAGSLTLGNWQGIFLWEHRQQRGNRRIIVHLS